MDSAETLLAPFCACEGDGVLGRFDVAKPYDQDGYTYATDTRIIVRIPQSGVARPHGRVPSPDILKRYWTNFPLVDAKPLPALPTVDPTPVKTECESCKGTGELTTCPECEVDGRVEWNGPYSDHEYSDSCELCDGNGVLDKKQLAKLRVKIKPEKCEDCAGAGLTMERPKSEDFEIDGWLFDLNYLSLIAKLPNVVFITGKWMPDYGMMLFESGELQGVLVGRNK